MELLYTYTDGSKLYKMSAKALIQVSIWKGNRIIDMIHVSKLKESVKNDITQLDSGYTTVQYTEYDKDNKPIKKTYVIDGQHRLSVIGSYYEQNPDSPDFFITVRQVKVDAESDAIDFFNRINNVKPLQFDEDPALIVNKYVKALQVHFNKTISLIRSGTTKRPYLSHDKLRDVLIKKVNELKNIPVDKFVQKCNEMNELIILGLTKGDYKVHAKDIKMSDKIVQLHFGLAWDEKYVWINQLLQN